MFDEKAVSLLVSASEAGKNTEGVERAIAKELTKYIMKDEFYQIPLPLITKILRAYEGTLNVEQAKKLLSTCSEKFGPESVCLLPFIKIEKISTDTASELIQCIAGVPLFQELKSQEPVQKSNSNPTKVFVDFPASANVQLVFRPAPKE